MRPKQIAQAIETCYRARRPLFVQGSPGIGKSESFKQVSDKLNIGLADFRLPQYDRVDLSGVPYVKNGQTLWATPAMWPRDGAGIALFDEVNAAPRELQPVLYQIFLERRLGDYQMPEGWVPMAAGNLETDRAITQKLSTALNGRMTHLLMEVHFEDWAEWAATHDIEPMVLAYLRFQPENLHQFDPSSAEKAFASPRSWKFVSDLLKADPPEEIMHELLGGTVGKGAAAAFAGFRKLYNNLPSLDQIIAKPDAAKVPTDPATLFAVTGGLARKSTAKNFGNVMTYARRIPREWCAYLVKDATRRDEAEYNKNPSHPRIKETAAYVEWATDNADIIA